LEDWKQKGLNVRGIVADVSTTEGRDAIMNQLMMLVKEKNNANVDQLDILVNNVSIYLYCF